MSRPWIVFEGPDRCGKSTQMRMASDWLEQQGIPVHTVRDPSSDVAPYIRKILLSEDPQHPTTEFLLFLAARSELYHRQIVPLLDAPGVILCDRYRLSTLVYQTSFGAGTQTHMHRLLGLSLEPDAYLVYVPKVHFDAPIENRWDDLSDAAHFALGQSYERAARHMQTAQVYPFQGETPEEVFEHFTRPAIERLLTEQMGMTQPG